MARKKDYEILESFNTAAGKVEIRLTKDGATQRLLNEKFHDYEDGRPAVVFANGISAHYKEGVLHKKGSPAIASACGNVEIWSENGHTLRSKIRNIK